MQKSPVPAHVDFCEFLQTSGIQLRYFKFFVVPCKPAVIFVHFPDETIDTPSTWKMLIKVSAFIISIYLAKLLGSKIVWEVNNLKSHERRYPLIETILMKIFTRSVAGAIHSSKSTMLQALALYPVLSRAESIVIPESNFHHTYPKQGIPARGRRLLGVEEGDIVLLSFGLVRRYKGADKLIDLLKLIEDPKLRLVVMGTPVDFAYAEELRRRARSDQRVRLIFRVVPEEDVPDVFAATSLACMPFRSVLNSASVLLALSLNCPVLAARLGAMSDLQERVGGYWLMLYEGELTLQAFRDAIDRSRSPRPMLAELEFCDFSKVAMDTLAFLVRIWGGPEPAAE